MKKNSIWILSMMLLIGCSLLTCKDSVHLLKTDDNMLKEDDIEEVIYNVAEYNKDEDFQILYEVLIDRMLFMPVDANSLPVGINSGAKFFVDSSMQIKIKNVQGPDGKLYIPSATLETSPILQGGYVSIDWFEYLKMALKIPEAEGVLIQGKTSYVGLDKNRIEFILNKYDLNTSR